MEHIDSYEQFCKAYTGGVEELKKEARLQLFIQNWIIRILDSMEEGTLDYSLKNMLDYNADRLSGEMLLQDALSRIVEDSELAFRHLNKNMREKIIRENVQMPVYKVREINSYGMNWLSRQSGKTVRQKISSAGNSIMAVQRRMSLDTAENRLLVAFAREMYEKLNTKLEGLSTGDPRWIQEEENLKDELAVFLKRDDIKEIRRWENLPPNNTLISDQNYKRIWHSWNEMKKIDERIKNTSDCMESRLATIFFVELLVCLREKLRIPQVPVEVDYDEYKVYLCEKQLSCLDGDRNIVKIDRENNSIHIQISKGNARAELYENGLMIENEKSETKKDEISVSFVENSAFIKVNGEEDRKTEITQYKIYAYVRYVATKIGIGKVKTNNIGTRKPVKKYKHVVVDLFSLHPVYISDESSFEKLAERLLQQKYRGVDIDGDQKDYFIACDTCNAIQMVSGVTETYTIPFAIDNGSMEQMIRLMHMMENYIVTDSLTYVFPDAYNELQLSMVHKAARMVYRRVRNIPLSIGCAFKFQTMEAFKSSFQRGDFLLVINLIDDEITFTLLSGEYDAKLESEISKYKGITWERHPTSTVSFKTVIDENIIGLLPKVGCIKSEKLYKLFGLEGLCDEVGNLSIYFGKDEWFQITPIIREIIGHLKLNITDAVAEFLHRNRVIVHQANVHIVSMLDNLIYKGRLPYYIISRQDALV